MAIGMLVVAVEERSDCYLYEGCSRLFVPWMMPSQAKVFWSSCVLDLQDTHLVNLESDLAVTGLARSSPWYAHHSGHFGRSAKEETPKDLELETCC